MNLKRMSAVFTVVLINTMQAQYLPYSNSLELDITSNKNLVLYGELIHVTINFINHSSSPVPNLSRSALHSSTILIDSNNSVYNLNSYYNEINLNPVLPGDTLKCSFELLEQFGNAFEYENKKVQVIRFLPSGEYKVISYLGKNIADTLNIRIVSPTNKYEKESLVIYLNFAQNFAIGMNGDFENYCQLLESEAKTLLTKYRKSPYWEPAAKSFIIMTRDIKRQSQLKEEIFDLVINSSSRYLNSIGASEEFRYYKLNYSLDYAIITLEKRARESNNPIFIKQAVEFIKNERSNIKK